MFGTQIIVKGRVQGVCFRYYTEQVGQRLNLNGFVRNLPTGDVEIIVQGSSSAVKEIESWCWKGSPYSSVTHVECKQIELQDPLPHFRIIS